MGLLESRTPAFRFIAPPLLGMVLVLALLAYGVLPWVSQSQRPQPAPAAEVAVDETAADKGTATAPAPDPDRSVPSGVRTVRVIRERAGVVGALTLGMTLSQAGERLGEELVSVQRSTARSARFEAVAPRSGVVVMGRAGRIDTIRVTNAGAAGRLWRTPDQLGIASRMQLVPRTYPAAQKICGSEYWVVHGANTARWAGGKRVTAFSLTSRKLPLFTPCGSF